MALCDAQTFRPTCAARPKYEWYHFPKNFTVYRVYNGQRRAISGRPAELICCYGNRWVCHRQDLLYFGCNVASCINIPWSGFFVTALRLMVP